MKSRFLNVIGTLLFALNQWLQIILITRFIGVYEVGLYSYFLAILAPFVLFNRFSFSVLLPTQRKFDYSYSVFLKFRNVFNYIFLFVTVVIGIFLNLTLYETICFMIFVAFKYYENKEEFIYAENISESNIKFLAISKILKSIINIVLVVLVIFLYESFMLLILSLLIGQLTIYLLYDRKFLIYNPEDLKDIKFLNFKNIFLLGISLTLVGVISSLNSNVPRYLLEHYHGVKELGVFSTIFYFATITQNIVMTINSSVISNLSKEKDRSLSSFYKFYGKIILFYIGLVSFVMIILFSFGSEILVLVYGSQFSEYQTAINLLAVQIALMTFYKTFEMALSIFNLYNIQVILQCVAFTSTLIFAFIFIIPYGVIGGFLVIVMSYSLLIILQLALLIIKTIKLRRLKY